MQWVKYQDTQCALHDTCRFGRKASAQGRAHRSALSVVFSKKSGFSAPTTESLILMSTSCSSPQASACAHPCSAPAASVWMALQLHHRAVADSASTVLSRAGIPW